MDKLDDFAKRWASALVDSITVEEEAKSSGFSFEVLMQRVQKHLQYSPLNEDAKTALLQGAAARLGGYVVRTIGGDIHLAFDCPRGCGRLSDNAASVPGDLCLQCSLEEMKKKRDG